MNDFTTEARNLPTRRGSISGSTAVWLLCSLIFAGFVYFSPWTSRTREQPKVERSAVLYQTQAIRDIEVGTWVLADNPELDEAESLVEVANLVRIDLQMVKPSGGLVDIQLLRPVGWLTSMGTAGVGSTIHLDLFELGAAGDAEVRAVHTYPKVLPRPSRRHHLVTGKFSHSSGEVLDIAVDGLEQPIGTTANHPWWSHDRQQFIQAVNLRVNERVLLTDNTTLRINSISPRAGPEPVYNLEVDVAHVYYVSSLGVLVHNNCELFQLDDYRVPRRAPALDNYRGRYNADRHANGLSRLPDDYDAHHAVPQRYRDHPEFQDFDFDAPGNIRGVKGSRADVNTHQRITNMWEDFHANNPNASRAQVEAFRNQIDDLFANDWF